MAWLKEADGPEEYQCKRCGGPFKEPAWTYYSEYPGASQQVEPVSPCCGAGYIEKPWPGEQEVEAEASPKCGKCGGESKVSGDDFECSSCGNKWQVFIWPEKKEADASWGADPGMGTPFSDSAQLSSKMEALEAKFPGLNDLSVKLTGKYWHDLPDDGSEQDFVMGEYKAQKNQPSPEPPPNLFE